MNQVVESVTQTAFWASQAQIKKINNLGKYFPKWGRKNESHRFGDRSIKKINHLGKYFPRWGRKNESHSLAQLLRNDKFCFCDRFIKWVGKSDLAKIENQGEQV